MSPKLQLGPRTQAVLILTLVLLVGVLAGVLTERIAAQQRTSDGVAQRAVADRRAGRPLMRQGVPFAGEPRDTPYGERLGAFVPLTAEQQTTVDSLMAEQRRRVRELTREIEPRFRQIATETRASMDSLLTPEQREQLRTLRRARQEQGRPRQGAPLRQ